MKTISSLFLILNYFALVGQDLTETNSSLKTSKSLENQIEFLAFNILNSPSDQTRDSLNNSLTLLLETELNEDLFHRSFDSVKSISILTPKDSAFRIFNWNIPYSDGSYNYECFLLKADGNIIYLHPTDTFISHVTDHTQWLAALYYEIIEKETQFGKYYTLLAWKGNDRLTTKKIIDVIWFSKSGEVKIGAPIFKVNKETKSRIIFEYSAQNKMQLKYNSRLDQVQFDHLSPPPRQNLRGIYEYYGPDLSYDALQWESNKWTLISDIDLDKGLKKKPSEFRRKEDIILEEQPIYRPK